MNQSQQEMIECRALALIRSHFDLLNQRRLEAVRGQLYFPPGMDQKPLEVYAGTMSRLLPFKVVSLLVSKFEEPRMTDQGIRASIKVDVKVDCALGARSTFFTIWWFPESERCEVSGRPTEWVLEQLEAEERAGKDLHQPTR